MPNPPKADQPRAGGWIAGLKRVPLHLAGFGALGFGFEFLTRHISYAPFVWILFFGVWRAYQERVDYSEGEDTAVKAALDFGSQYIGAATGILAAWRHWR